MWVLRRTGDNLFVAKSGRQSSYTRFLQHAKLFTSKNAAVADSCIENEIPVNIDNILK